MTDKIRQAMDIIAEWPDYAAEFKSVDDFHARLVLPNRVGQLRILPGRIMYTWSRLDEPIFDLPRAEHWKPEGHMLWLCDLCYDRGIGTKKVIQDVREDMISNGIAVQDETIVFWRSYSGRYGFGKVRSKDGIRQQNADSGQRSIREHARLAEGQLHQQHRSG